MALWIGAVLGCKTAEPPPAPPPPVQPVPSESFDSCNVDADCAFGEIDHEILGSEDCPCLYGCPFTPLNKTTIERRQSQYDRACDPSENGSGDSCGVDDCAPAPTPACIAGKCSAVR